MPSDSPALPLIPVALSIAGSDSSAGAGIQADLKTFAACGVYGATAITAITAQNTQGVADVEVMQAALVAAQIQAVVNDMPVAAVKTGMLANRETVMRVAQELETLDLPLVVDPLMVSSSGRVLLASDAVATMKSALIPLAALITPNIDEAAALLGQPRAQDLPEAIEQALALLGLGSDAVLLTGGHLPGEESVDVFCSADGLQLLRSPKLTHSHTHGTGCTLSAAACAYLALGKPALEACRAAKAYVQQALQAAPKLQVGRGRGPLNHFYARKEFL